MARSEVHPVGLAPAAVQEQARLAVAERRLRRISAWLLLFFLLQGELGAVWDREWHAYVGRDQFWTPPHELIYSCVSGAGLLALAIVLTETVRYRRAAPGVNDDSTISIFRLFHAPLGFVVLGFGALLALVAAPLDNYWHELYGIDIALWAPFHMMGVTGGTIGILGIVYTFASEASIERQTTEANGRAPWRFLGFSALELGALMTLAGLLNFTLTGFLQFPVPAFGPLSVSTYPLPLAVGGAFCFMGALRFTRRPGTATLIVLLLLLHTLAVELFVPWAIRAAVAQQGLMYRIPGHIPFFRWDYTLLPLLFLISALIVDGVTLWQQRHSKASNIIRGTRNIALLGAIITPPTFLTAPYILRDYSQFAPVFLPQPGLPIPLALWIGVVAFSVCVAIAMGAGGALLGSEFGEIWRWSMR
jgi:hypothetical protein